MEARRVSLLRNGRSQALRIPKAFELPGTEATIIREGDRLVVEPVRRSTLLDYLTSKEPLDEDCPDIEDSPPRPVEL